MRRKAVFNIANARDRFKSAVDLYGYHGFVKDKLFRPKGHQKARCEVCGMWQGSRIHLVVTTTKRPKTKASKGGAGYGASKANRVALAQAIAKYGHHFFERDARGFCDICGLTHGSRIHDPSRPNPRPKPAAVVAPNSATVTTNASSAVVTLHADNSVVVRCPWCNGTGSVRIPRDALLKMMTQEQH